MGRRHEGPRRRRRGRGGARGAAELKPKHASIAWTDGLAFEARAEDGTTLLLDASGTDGGHGPATLLLTSLAGCTGADTISILRKKRQKIDTYRIEVDGEQRSDHPRYYTRIVVRHELTGGAIDDAAVERAIELSATRYCTVSATVALGRTRIEHCYRIRDDAGERSAEATVIGPDGAGIEPAGGRD